MVFAGRLRRPGKEKRMSAVIFTFGGAIIGWALERLRGQHRERREARERQSRLDRLFGRQPQDR